ncbi:metal ABC transporter substrate-binding protein, partial [Treponema sp. R6D11]
YLGGESDEWVEDILESIDTSKKTVIKLTDYVKNVEEEIVPGMEEEEGEEETGEPEYDEHIWTAPANAIKLVSAIADKLSGADAKNKNAYKYNADKYIKEIKKVDDSIKSIIKNGKRDKIVVADKFPFRYFVDEFNLKYVAAFPGCSDQTDASAKTIAYIVD